MITTSRSCLLGLLVLALTSMLPGQGNRTALTGRTISLAKQGLPLEDALAAIQEQTGMTVADMRVVKSPVALNLDFDKIPFWQGLEAIVRQADARLSVYQPDGNVALISGPYRTMPVSYDGVFRTLARRIAVLRDLETGADTCTIQLETAWEPWFKPFYLEVGPAVAGFSNDRKVLKVNIPARGKDRLAGRSAIETELRLAAPPRSVQNIDFLKGSFKVIGPTKMLTFRFENLQPNAKGQRPLVLKQEGIAVKLARIVQQPDRWSFDIIIENPPGGPVFESYQSWLDNNQIVLEKGQGKSKQVLRHSPEDEEALENVTATRAGIRYHFSPGSGSLGKLDGWTLVYVTPGRIMETTVEYSFKGLMLP